MAHTMSPSDDAVAGDRVPREMDDDSDRGWPLGEAHIRSKYYALVKRDLERKMLRAQAKHLAYNQMLKESPVTLPKSRSTQEAYSRARSLQRALRRAGLTDTSGKGSQSVPVSSSPSPEHESSGAPSLLSRLKNDVASPVDQEDVPKATVSVPSSGTPGSQPPTRSEIHGKRTKFLAKQFKLISSSKTAPRRNIKILGKATSDEAKGIHVAEKIERDQLQERIRMHDCDTSNPSSIKSMAGDLASEDQGSSLRVDSLSRALGPLISRKAIASHSGHYTDYAHANSPSSLISDEVSEASIPETVLSTPENQLAGRGSKRTSRKASFSRERWTSREIFGSFDFEGELDIDGIVTEGRDAMPDPSEFSSWNLDGYMSSWSSGALSPRQSSVTWNHYIRGRVEHRSVPTRRMKVTSPSSLFQDGPWYNGGTQASSNNPRKLSRKLSTSFNKRRKQAMQVQPLPHAHDKSQLLHAGLSTRNLKEVFHEKSAVGKKESSKRNHTLEIASLLSGFKDNSEVKSRIGSFRVSNGVSVQQEATMAFQDDIAQLMLDGSEIAEIGDIEEFLDGYMRLRSPFYLEVVEEFFRNVSYDCYKRPLDVKKLPPKVPHR